VTRGPKRGFAVDVVDDWYRHSVGGILDETLLDPKSLLYELLEPAPVEDLLVSHRRGRRDNHKLLHSLVVTELWMREFIG
jgi:asparagine synthase (glutamine-hydrolysing)